MKILTKEEEDEHYRAVLRGGISGGLVGLGAGLGSALILHKRWPFFKQLTLPFRAFYVTSVATFVSIIQADRYSRAYEAARHENLRYQDTTSRLLAEQQANRSNWEKAMALGKEYRYTIVSSSWAASMAGAWWYVSRDRYLTTAQKLVQARVYAQGLTLMILVATAAFELSDAKAAKEAEKQRQLDPAHAPARVHREHYQGEDLWKDMVEAEEKRLAARRAAADEKVQQ
ncbi:mitochondrial hypoxia responsive domain-containing protein [Pyronema domesticum]|uniref:Similar to Altered inheritance rate of mitochondria protein 38 homolog acc. no. Q9P3B2 n=1 Tax=Pyronema omphalodes (strain CBS 100304) TaxID=1076935 RepID=U4KYZ1_PYROM|nr:mitochondrial hypoxia responsive domain-containing protein [Pyronema domesticum]CCX07226.1 Similar to Altered inheritance rate of mitochondria protein 38 homolog; acc. no. Q9P3B2 [Pyronema omphalodes CBS 100304]